MRIRRTSRGAETKTFGRPKSGSAKIVPHSRCSCLSDASGSARKRAVQFRARQGRGVGGFRDSDSRRPEGVSLDHLGLERRLADRTPLSCTQRNEGGSGSWVKEAFNDDLEVETFSGLAVAESYQVLDPACIVHGKPATGDCGINSM